MTEIPLAADAPIMLLTNIKDECRLVCRSSRCVGQPRMGGGTSPRKTDMNDLEKKPGFMKSSKFRLRIR